MKSQIIFTFIVTTIGSFHCLLGTVDGAIDQASNEFTKKLTSLMEARTADTNSSAMPRTKPTVCRYLITKKYECLVPKQCNNTDQAFSCIDSVNGVWSDADDIVHYHDVCVWTDHFSTCTFNVNSSYECRMVWEQRHHPNGSYTGDAVAGFRRVADVTLSPNPRKTTTSVGSSETPKHAKRTRTRRAGGGTC